MRLSRTQLLEDLYQAYYDARRHKRNKPYQLRFEADLECNMNELCDALLTRTYRPLPSDCFIITDPKKREVFAAHFRDRVVHHLYYNYAHEMFERTFIADSYSCIKGRGTHYGIRRLYRHILSESRCYSRPCFVLKMDIRGYFMHIDRDRLLNICLGTLDKMSRHRVGRYRPTVWDDVLDFDLLRYLSREIILLNPVDECRLIGPASDWEGLPPDKSLFHSPAGCGLPIGNLTSQLFSNVYLNVLDQYMKRVLHCTHYGRYVDDFYVVSADREWLAEIVPSVESFLQSELGLAVHRGKTAITKVEKGVEFLGAFLLPHRVYSSRGVLERMDAKLDVLERDPSPGHVAKALNSYCGVLSHWNDFRVRKLMLQRRHDFGGYGFFDRGLLRFFSYDEITAPLAMYGRRRNK